MIDFASLIESAVNGNKNDHRIALQQIVSQLTLLNTSTGNGFGQANSQAPTPDSATLAAAGANGLIVLNITNPAKGPSAVLWHEISYSPVKNFSQSVTTTVTTATQVVIPAPGQSPFIRVRSSYDRKNWNTYQLAQTSAVDAGLQTSAASSNNMPLNQSNFANVDSIANGASAAIRVYGTAGPYHSYVSVKGGVQTVRPSATIINASYGSSRIVAFDGDQFQMSPILSGVFSDDWEPVGTVSVVNSGSPTLPTLTPIIQSGHIISATFTPGSGMTQAPTLTVADSGGGTGAVLVGQVSGGQLVSVTVQNPGSNYTVATTITAAGGVFSGSQGGGGVTSGNGGRLTNF